MLMKVFLGERAYAKLMGSRSKVRKRVASLTFPRLRKAEVLSVMTSMMKVIIM